MPTNEKTAASVLDAADASFQQRQYGEARETYKEALKLSRAEFNPSIEVEALSQIGRTYLATNQLDDARPWLDEASSRARENDPMGWSRYLSVLGRLQWKDKKLPDARRTFEDLYRYCGEHNLNGRAVDAANMIAIVSEDYDEQVTWYKRGIEMAEKGDADSWLGPLWNNLACAHSDHGKIDDALICFEKARHFHWLYSSETAKLFADYHVGMTLRHLGRFDEALRWLRPVLAWAERMELHSAIAQTLEDIGEIAIARNDAKSGLADLKEAREHFRLAGYDEKNLPAWERINSRISALGG